MRRARACGWTSKSSDATPAGRLAGHRYRHRLRAGRRRCAQCWTGLEPACPTGAGHAVGANVDAQQAQPPFEFEPISVVEREGDQARLMLAQVNFRACHGFERSQGRQRRKVFVQCHLNAPRTVGQMRRSWSMACLLSFADLPWGGVGRIIGAFPPPQKPSHE